MSTFKFDLDREVVIPKLVPNPSDYLMIAGLGGTARDTTRLTKAGSNLYTLGGAMGAAASMGLGLALARPDKKVLVVTGDGELLMSLGTLATIAVLNPPNLSIICVDNGHYGETGYQVSHTGRGVNLEEIAIGAGIKVTATVQDDSQIANGAKVVAHDKDSSFVLLRISTKESSPIKRNLNAADCRIIFRKALLG
jgi:phosphonopyruvate decarboxylase